MVFGFTVVIGAVSVFTTGLFVVAVVLVFTTGLVAVSVVLVFTTGLVVVPVVLLFKNWVLVVVPRCIVILNRFSCCICNWRSILLIITFKGKI